MNPWHWWKRLGRDWRIAALLALVAAAAGMIQVIRWPGTPSFYQNVLGPSVLMACGHGLENPVLEELPELDAFLHPPFHVDHPPEYDVFDCGCLGESPPTQPMTPFQSRHLYLLMAVGFCWHFLGVAWSALPPLYGLLHGASAAALYGLFRLIARPPIAAACCVLLFLSPVQLDNLVRLRDYSKAPFILGALLILGWLLVHRPKWRGMLGWSAAAGAVLGLGYGFRMDTMIVVPAFCVCLLLLVEGQERPRLPHRMAACALLVAAYLFASLPAQLEWGASNKYHYMIMGFSDIYDGRLGVGGTPYNIVHRYYDAEPLVTLQGHAGYADGAYAQLAIDTPAYEAMGRAYTRQVMRTFPADFVVRPLAAVLRTIDELGTSAMNPAPRGVTNLFVHRLFEGHALIMGLLLRYARYAVPLALVIIAARSLRLGLAALFLLLYLCGYGAIQFAGRHYFHLQFISLWAVVLVLLASARGAWALRLRDVREAIGLNARGWTFMAMPGARRLAWFGAAVLFGLVLPLLVLSAWQHVQVGRLLARYEEAPRQRIDWRATPHDGLVRIQGAHGAGTDTFPGPGAGRYFGMEMLVAEFDTTDASIGLGIEYESNNTEGVLSWGATLPRAPGTTRLYFPVYRARLAEEGDKPGLTLHYRGLNLDPNALGYLKGLYTLENPKALPLHLTATLPQDWRRLPRVQRLVR